jgi:Spy/CpxP family protein refolding chaperone
MPKLLTRKLILALALVPSAVTAAHAATAVPSPAPPPPSPTSVTGGDPEPISPSGISMILAFLFIGIK